MSQYCDTSKLEAAWFKWIVARAVPALEPYRESGKLWSKTIGLVEVDGTVLVKSGRTYNSPTHPIRAHCILSRYPVFFTTHNGIPQEYGSMLCLEDDNTIHSKPVLMANLDSEMDLSKQPIPKIEEYLLKDGYTTEDRTNHYWNLVLCDINLMCMGISTKFHQKTEEDQIELANEALLQVINKLVSDRLVYTPGRAPVFNLLTTTIYRCMYSIMNKRKNQREGINKLLADASAGKLPKTNRSLRVPFTSKKPRL